MVSLRDEARLPGEIDWAQVLIGFAQIFLPLVEDMGEVRTC